MYNQPCEFWMIADQISHCGRVDRAFVCIAGATRAVDGWPGWWLSEPSVLEGEPALQPAAEWPDQLGQCAAEPAVGR